MMAAGRAAEQGARVVLLEKNAGLGKKLLITGGGRCNVTNAEFRREVLGERYGEGGKFLHSLFARFGPRELIDFLARFGLATVVEEENRVFPATHRASSILEVLARYLERGSVELRCRTEVRGLRTDAAGRRVAEAVTAGSTIRAREFVLATGGLSHPETGSTGEGFRWLEAIGHSVRRPEPSLVPLRVVEAWVARLSGLSFEDARLSAVPLAGERPPGIPSERGKLLFTHFGLSGPLALNLSSGILDLSREMGDARGRLRLLVDLLPTVDHGALDRAIRESFAAAPNRKVRNSLPPIVPGRMAPVLLELAHADPDLPAHSLTRTTRLEIVRLMKALPLTFDGLLGADRAIVTSGGVALEEVDFRSMRSRRFDNLYLTGDLLDFDRRSGGYSLQICWSSGWVAGSAAASAAARTGPSAAAPEAPRSPGR